MTAIGEIWMTVDTGSWLLIDGGVESPLPPGFAFGAIAPAESATRRPYGASEPSRFRR